MLQDSSAMSSDCSDEVPLPSRLDVGHRKCTAGRKHHEAPEVMVQAYLTWIHARATFLGGFACKSGEKKKKGSPERRWIFEQKSLAFGSSSAETFRQERNPAFPCKSYRCSLPRKGGWHIKTLQVRAPRSDAIDDRANE